MKQFLEDIEKEKIVMKKRKNAPSNDYSAEKMMRKFAAPEAKKSKLLNVDDDFSEFLTEKKIEKLENSTKIEEKIEIIQVAETGLSLFLLISFASFEYSTFSEIKPPPILQKSVSTPESSKSTRKFITKFQSPLLTHQSSAPPVLSDKIQSKGETSKYFAKKTTENGSVFPDCFNLNRCVGFSTPKVSNPFRCPAFVKPSPVTQKNEENVKDFRFHRF